MIQILQKKFLQQLPFWLAAGLTALLAVGYAKIFALCEEWALTRDVTTTYWAAPLGIIISFLIGYFISKESIGSGIPQILASAELAEKQNPILKKILSLKMIVVKIIGSCICVIGGGSTGREGPTLQISAAIFYQLNRFWPKKLSRPPDNLMVIAGGAAGLAAAFNTPLGGVVFAIEEISKTHISHIRTTVFQAVIIAGVISQMVMGNYLYIGKSTLDTSAAGLMLYTVLFSIIIGLTGAAFAESLYRIGRWRKNTTFTKQFVLTLFSAAAFVGIFYFCGAGTLGAGKGVMQKILQGESTSAFSSELWVGRLFGNFFTYIAGVIGGIFAPALASGATLAQWLTGLLNTGSSHVLILVGMVAFLTGVTRTPFTSFILVFEMTSSHEVILYLMLAGLISNVVAKLVNHESFYEQVAHDIKGTA
ncbi:chloride channel protein [Bdellovibrio sp. qaytius]|nr:chloride channel protein [Bdellovibrio sp. qaytius]